MLAEKWFTEFQRYLEGLEEEHRSSQSSLSLLGFALKNQKIPSLEYIKWAQKTYNLPYIKDEYFKSHLPSKDDWKNWKNDFSWSAEVVPLTIWDGHIIVACLEIPMKFPASLHPVFVLADFKNIEKVYEFYINSDKGSQTAKEKMKNLFESPSTSNLKTANGKNITTTKKTDVDKEPSMEAPEGLVLNFEQKFEQKKDLNPHSTENQSTNQAPSLFSSPSFTETSSPSVELFYDSENSFPENVKKEIIEGMPYLISLKKNGTEKFETITQEFFQKHASFYNKFILFSIDASELRAIPVSWSDYVHPVNKNIEHISLTQPSIFKIVAATIKPYHGYVTINEINEKFFEFWNEGEIASNVTIIPLIIKNKVVGMVLGMGESSSYTWKVLQTLECDSKNLIKSFDNFFKIEKLAV